MTSLKTSFGAPLKASLNGVEILRECLCEAGSDVLLGLEAAEYILTNQLALAVKNDSGGGDKSEEDRDSTNPAFLYGQSEGAGPITTTATDTAAEPRERKSFHRKKIREKRSHSHKRGRRKGRRLSHVLRSMRIKKKWVPVEHSGHDAPLALEKGHKYSEKSPGPGWVHVKTGPRGGKIWARSPGGKTSPEAPEPSTAKKEPAKGVPESKTKPSPPPSPPKSKPEKPGKAKKPTVDETVKRIGELKASGADIKEILDALNQHGVFELRDIKSGLGIKASGATKAAFVSSIAERVMAGVKAKAPAPKSSAPAPVASAPAPTEPPPAPAPAPAPAPKASDYRVDFVKSILDMVKSGKMTSASGTFFGPAITALSSVPEADKERVLKESGISIPHGKKPLEALAEHMKSVAPVEPAPVAPTPAAPEPSTTGTEPSGGLTSMRPLDVKTSRLLDSVTETSRSNKRYNLKVAASAVESTPEEIERRLNEAWEKAEVTMNFKPSMKLPTGGTMADSLISEGRLKNLFEVGTGGGSTFKPGRKGWERKNFGDDVDRLPDSERPKYGAINWSGDKSGAAPDYGSAVFVLNKDSLRSRMTCAVGNTSVTTSKDVGSGDSFVSGLARNEKALKAAGFKSISRVDAPLSSHYNEVQIWGHLPINKDTISVIRLKREFSYGIDTHWAAGSAAKSLFDENNSKIEKYARSLGIPVEYY